MAVRALTWAIAAAMAWGSKEPARAGDIEIVMADFKRIGGEWKIAVTLRHADSGWDHYANEWRIVDERGNIIATRKLLHPHDTEQPFTRDVTTTLPDAVNVVFVEAHDKVHGWSPQRVRVNLREAAGPRFRVTK